MKALFAIALALTTSACALMQDRSPAKIRYFSPEPIAAPTDASSGDRTVEPAPDLRIRLARVDAAAYIQDRIAFRDAGVEVGYYGTLRWADPPESTLQRVLARALFEERQVREIVSGAGPVLEVDLEAFEELRQPRHAARIVVTWRLRDTREVSRQQTLTIERPITASEDPDQVGNALAAAMADAMTEVVDRVVGDVVTALASDRSAAAQPAAPAE